MKTLLHLDRIDPERLGVRIVPTEIGNHKIHIRFNAVEIPQSPLKFTVCDDTHESSIQSMLCLCVFVFVLN